MILSDVTKPSCLVVHERIHVSLNKVSCSAMTLSTLSQLSEPGDMPSPPSASIVVIYV